MAYNLCHEVEQVAEVVTEDVNSTCVPSQVIDDRLCRAEFRNISCYLSTLRLLITKEA